MNSEEVDALLASMTTPRDLAIFLLMLDWGLPPGEVLCLRLDDLSYGRRRATVGRRDDHPRGVRKKAQGPSCFAVFVDQVPAAAQAARTARVSCGVACSGRGPRNLAAMMTRRSLMVMSS
jgi:integrase